MTPQSIILNQLSAITNGHLLLQLPDGSEHHFGDPSEPVRLHVNNSRFFSRLLFGGNIGFGDAWTDGDWDAPDLTAVLELFIHNMASLQKRGLTAGLAKRLLHLIAHAKNRNTESGSKRNIHAHYDLGNDFYSCFLDPETMLYSAALFSEGTETLAEAQRAKIDRLIELADLRKGDHVLEIGCGWGGFAIRAAQQTGCRVTGITLSDEQYAFARQRVKEEGLDPLISIEKCDYRHMTGAFDRIVSIEMLEAVGHAFYGTYFAACDRLLKPGGRVALQVITIPDQRYKSYRSNPDWIQKRIFPGGMLPSLTELSKAITARSSFTIEQLDNIGIHYAETLRRWRTAFEAHHQELIEMGYDEAFQRKWIYYLCYCEAGFQTRYTNNLHLLLTRPGEPQN
jgi:cyclopropane-fatty-acyl-phospholipid synthase